MNQAQHGFNWIGVALLLVILAIPANAQEEIDCLSFAHGAFPID